MKAKEVQQPSPAPGALQGEGQREKSRKNKVAGWEERAFEINMCWFYWLLFNIALSLKEIIMLQALPWPCRELPLSTAVLFACTISSYPSIIQTLLFHRTSPPLPAAVSSTSTADI